MVLTSPARIAGRDCSTWNIGDVGPDPPACSCCPDPLDLRLDPIASTLDLSHA
jgi:hypothetical protein